jgi:hypothetical protein
VGIYLEAMNCEWEEEKESLSRWGNKVGLIDML